MHKILLFQRIKRLQINDATVFNVLTIKTPQKCYFTYCFHVIRYDIYKLLEKYKYFDFYKGILNIYISVVLSNNDILLT